MTFCTKTFINTSGPLLIRWPTIWHSSILDAWSVRWADCDADHYLVVAKVKERMAI